MLARIVWKIAEFNGWIYFKLTGQRLGDNWLSAWAADLKYRK